MRFQPLLVTVALGLSFNAALLAATCNPDRILTQTRPAELMNVVVVAGYSSGTDIAPELGRLGVRNIIHVHPEKEVPERFRRLFETTASAYVRDITYSEYNGDIEKLAGILRTERRNIDAVFAGTETGVGITDLLNKKLGLPGNDPAMSELHRNKTKMQKRLAEAGLSSIHGFETNNVGDALGWIADSKGNSGRYPVVVKPIDASGTRGVHVCFDETQVREAFVELFANSLGLQIDKVLVQRFVDADEYVVNTVSKGGKHTVTDVWLYHKITIKRPGGSSTKIYDYDELLEFDSPAAQALIAYNKKALDALSITEGPAHMEVMLPKDGPVMMEVGTRLMGGHVFEATRATQGTSSLDLMISAALFPKNFDDIAWDMLKVRKRIRSLQLIARQSGKVTKVRYSQDELKSLLPSLAKFSAAGTGDTIQTTVDLATSPGILWLISESEAQLERDHRKFRDEIEPGLYELAAE